MDRHPDLTETLRQAQRFGFFGARPIEEAVAHAEHYVDAIEERSGRLVDLGSGGGLPGLVIAAARPDLEVVLLDRRQKRTDFLERAVHRLELSGVSVLCCDAGELTRTIESGREPPFDVVTARGFGPPEFTLRTAVACLRPGGCVVISEPPSGDRWDPVLLAELRLSPTRLGPVTRFTT